MAVTFVIIAMAWGRSTAPGEEGGGVIIEVGAQQRAPGALGGCVEEQTHRTTMLSPCTKQMGRDPDTGPKILSIPEGLLDRRSGLEGMGNTMVC